MDNKDFKCLGIIIVAKNPQVDWGPIISKLHPWLQKEYTASWRYEFLPHGQYLGLKVTQMYSTNQLTQGMWEGLQHYLSVKFFDKTQYGVIIHTRPVKHHNK